MFELILNRLRGKRILILGFGREGKSSFHFVQKYLPNAEVAVADKNELEGVKHFGNYYLESMYDYDIVIKTPGISLKDFDTKGVEITSQTDLFLSQFHAQTIGISGTKGKSTTTSLIYHLLKSSGRDAILTGNIGIPCFDIMEDIKPDSIVVYELSAHQLEYVHNSPHVGVLLNVFEEHLDHFGTFERYKSAKLNLLRFMGEDDTAIIHDMLINDALRVIASKAKQSRVFTQYDFDEIDRSALPMKGEHNYLNVKAALLACDAYGVDYRELIPYLYTFKPLEHRLEPVGTFGGVTFVNDSISTIPQAAISACKALQKVDFLLLGGFDRGIDYQPLVDYLKENPVPHLLFTGKAGERMMQLMDGILTGSMIKVHESVEGPSLFNYSNMEEAFAYLKDHAKQGDVCLLSPAASSYDQYKNFEERGRKFKALAEAFGEK